jgi:His-Xaa-Ser system radical SAM maturase HxsB
MSAERAYTLFPFRFMRFGKEILLVNEVGEFIFISEDEFSKLQNYQIDTKSKIFLDLKSKHIVTDSDLTPPIYLLATKYRTKKSFLNDFTALHIFIITLRCNQKCKYCQANSEDEGRTEFDMDIDTARKCVDLVFKSPSPAVKIEFQGGEPLLNFETVRYVVQYGEKINKLHHKRLEFVICTNLLALNSDILKFLEEHDIWISTSLDGPKELHDINRITRKGAGTYDIVTKNIKWAKEKIGNHLVDALIVTTKDNVNRLNEVIDEYVKQGFNSIFIRTLHPFGRAAKAKLGYDVDLFFENYKKALDYLIKLNLNGVRIAEQYATIIMSKILTPFPGGFVDLQSPAGTGISCAVYGYNGDVFVSDEARMLAKMGDNRFLMGNVYKNKYEEIFKGKVIRETIENSCVESLPQCSECAFQMYCGADPVRNYYVQNDMVGHRPTSEFHQLNYLIIRHLMELIKQNNQDIMNVFWSWITNRPINEIKRFNRG